MRRLVLLLALALALSAGAAAAKGHQGGGGPPETPPGHDPGGPGNSENAPGHDPAGPGNSENAPGHTGEPKPEPKPEEPKAAHEPAGPEPAKREEKGRPEDKGPEKAVEKGRSEAAGKPEGAGKPEDKPERGRGHEKREERIAREERGHGAPPPEERGRRDEVPAAALERTAVEDARVEVREGERPVDVAAGEVVVEGRGVASAARAVMVLVHPNGSEEVIAERATSAPWNTSAYENGYYDVHVRETRDDGSVVTVASTRVLVENARATPVTAVAAVATGAAVSAGAGALAARGVDVLGLLRSTGANVATEVVEDKLRTRTAGATRWDRRVLSTSLLLAAVAGAMLAFFKTYADRGSLLLALPIAFAAAFACTVGDYAAEWALARASGAQARFRLWIPGAVSLALSSVLFRSAFGYPGYVSEVDHDRGAGAAQRLERKAALRALAFLGASLALAAPFLLLGALWRWDVAEYGVGVALMMAAAASMPFSPMPGRDVWRWSRLAWCAAFGALAALYVLWQLAMLPALGLVTAAAVGAGAFVVGLRALRPTPPP